MIQPENNTSIRWKLDRVVDTLLENAIRKCKGYQKKKQDFQQTERLIDAAADRLNLDFPDEQSGVNGRTQAQKEVGVKRCEVLVKPGKPLSRM